MRWSGIRSTRVCFMPMRRRPPLRPPRRRCFTSRGASRCAGKGGSSSASSRVWPILPNRSAEEAKSCLSAQYEPPAGHRTEACDWPAVRSFARRDDRGSQGSIQDAHQAEPSGSGARHVDGVQAARGNGNQKNQRGLPAGARRGALQPSSRHGRFRCRSVNGSSPKSPARSAIAKARRPGRRAKIPVCHKCEWGTTLTHVSEGFDQGQRETVFASTVEVVMPQDRLTK